MNAAKRPTPRPPAAFLPIGQESVGFLRQAKLAVDRIFWQLTGSTGVAARDNKVGECFQEEPQNGVDALMGNLPPRPARFSLT
jgi:hypothetical protein